MKDPVEVLILERYIIKIYVVDNDSYLSSTNSEYNKRYSNGDNYTFTTVIGIKIYEDENLIDSCLIASSGGATGINPNSSLISYGNLVICCSDSIFSLSIPDLGLTWVIKADIATCFEIFYLDAEYIVHGELSITRINKYGEIVWQQYGADIFTTIDGTDNFEVTEKYIFATDWNNKKYVFDYSGNLIENYEPQLSATNTDNDTKSMISKPWWKFW